MGYRKAYCFSDEQAAQQFIDQINEGENMAPCTFDIPWQCMDGRWCVTADDISAKYTEAVSEEVQMQDVIFNP